MSNGTTVIGGTDLNILNTPICFPESPLKKGVHWTDLEKVLSEYMSQIKNITNPELLIKREIAIEELRMNVHDTSAVPACLNCRVALVKIFSNRTKISDYICHFQKFLLALCDLLPVDKIIDSDVFSYQLEIVSNDFFVRVCSDIDGDIAVKISYYQKILLLNNSTLVVLNAYKNPTGSTLECFEKIRKAIDYATNRTKLFTKNLLDNMDAEFDSLEKNMEMMNIIKNLDQSGVNNKIKQFRNSLGAWILNVQTALNIHIPDQQGLRLLSLCIHDTLNYVRRDESFLKSVSVYFQIPGFLSLKQVIVSNLIKAIVFFKQIQSREYYNILTYLNNDFQAMQDKITDENLKTEISGFIESYKQI